MQELIARCGLLVVFIGAALEGDGVMVLTGVAAHLRLLGLPTAIAAGTLGAFVSDCVWYVVGRREAAAARQTRAYRRLGPTVLHLADRFGAREIVAARFVFGTRVVSMLYWGTQGLPFGRFAMLDLIGCSLWATTLATLGFAFSGSAEVLLGKVRRVETWLLVAAVASVSVAVLVRRALRWWVHRPQNT